MGLLSQMALAMVIMVGASGNLRSRPATNETEAALLVDAALHYNDGNEQAPKISF